MTTKYTLKSQMHKIHENKLIKNFIFYDKLIKCVWFGFIIYQTTFSIPFFFHFYEKKMKRILCQLNHLEESKNKRVSKAWNSIVNFCRKERISRIKIQNNKITFQERTK